MPKNKTHLLHGLLGCVLVAACSRAPAVADNDIQESKYHHFQAVTVVEGLEHPWSLAFLPSGEWLISERPGRLRVVRDGKLEAAPVAGVPEVVAINQGGLHPQTGEIWQHEHGPQGGDEINLIRRGVNYGWPTITYGRQYVTGARIGIGTHKEGMEQPLKQWTPSIAPSGLAFYTGDAFPQWRGDLFVGALAGAHLARVRFDGIEEVEEEQLLRDVLGRIRDVRMGPDGLLYLLTDSPDGRLVRLQPVD